MSPRRTHIAMVGIPAVSHVLPSLEIVRELVARGHRVTYANDPAVAGLITATGAEFVPYGSVLPVADNDWPDDPIAAMGIFLDDAVQALPQLRAAYDQDGADLYLYDIGAYAARALAESQGRPVLQLSPTFVAWDGYDEGMAAQLWGLPGADAYRTKFAQWLAVSGASTTDVDVFSGRPARALAMIPRSMQPHADQVDTDVVTFRRPLLRLPRGPGHLDAAGRCRERPADLAGLGVHEPAGVLPPVPGRLRQPGRLARRTPDRQVHGPGRAR